jgi:hypothetical protein
MEQVQHTGYIKWYSRKKSFIKKEKANNFMLNHSLILVNLCYNTQKPAFLL